MKLLFSGYGHPPQYIYSSAKGDIIELASQSGMLGLPVPNGVRHESETVVKPGDRIFLYTDGVTEAMNSSREIYGRERLELFLRDSGSFPSGKFSSSLMDDLHLFVSGEFADDICMLDIAVKREAYFGYNFSLG
jgi:phosphoserine phosphatase RsbU/P